MIHFSVQDISKLTKLKRAALINGISGIKPLNLIGSISEKGEHNLAVFNSVTHIGSNPPLLGFILRPTTVERHTYENMLAMRVFTINQVSTSIYKEAHQTSANYSKEVSEFEAVGLTPQIISPHKAPFVKESNIKVACAYRNEYFIKENGCRHIIAEILDIYAEEKIISENGFVNLEQAEAVGAIGLDAYVSLNLLDRLDYARPDQPIKSILKDGTP
jgi:flavin reductase (DIM6/NTAB) family NADH-FMN oxidoreductase RutF